MVFFLVSLARDGGSIPPPAINPSIVQRIKNLLSMNVELNPIAFSSGRLTVIGGKYGEVAQLVEQ